MIILRRIERRWAHWMLTGIREQYTRAEIGLRLQLYKAEQANEALESGFMQLLNAVMDLSKDYDALDASEKSLRLHANCLASSIAEDCEMDQHCNDCESWRCPVFKYLIDGSIYDNR
jgi:hypothetical protein